MSWGPPIAHDRAGTGPPHYAAVDCPRAFQCTAIDETGSEVTFNPRRGKVVSGATMQPRRRGGVRWRWRAQETTSQCTTVDLAGRAVTFDPHSPKKVVSRPLVPGHALLGISCPAVGQCTAVSQNRREITFDPRSQRKASFRRLGTKPGTGVTVVSCPSVTSCIAGDGAGNMIGFNPRKPGRLKPRKALHDSFLALACPSTELCVGVVSAGTRVTFLTNPKGGTPTLKRGTVSVSRVDRIQPNALSCPSTTYCVLGDAAGRIVEFDPGASGATSVKVIAPNQSLSSISCPTRTRCVAVDVAGNAFTGAGKLPARPAATGPLTVSGKTEEGQVLKGSMRWTRPRTSLRFQWQRCPPKGGHCRDIPEEGGPTYKIAHTDVGHRLRLLEQAANQAGVSAIKVSPETQVVTDVGQSETV